MLDGYGLFLAFAVVVGLAAWGWTTLDRSTVEIDRLRDEGTTEYQHLTAILDAFDYQEPICENGRYKVCDQFVGRGHADDCAWRDAVLRRWSSVGEPPRRTATTDG